MPMFDYHVKNLYRFSRLLCQWSCLSAGLKCAKRYRYRQGSCDGLSILEITVSIGIVGAIFYGGSRFLSDIGPSFNRIDQRQQDVVMQSQKVFSRHFLELMSRSSLSLSYMTTYVPFSQSCQNVDNGPCFLSLNKHNQIRQVGNYKAALLSSGFVAKLPQRKMGGLNFFQDQTLTKTKSACEDPSYYQKVKMLLRDTCAPKGAQFKKTVLRSKDERSFVGWSLKDKDKNPFYIMSSPKIDELIHFVFPVGGGNQNQQDTDRVVYLLPQQQALLNESEQKQKQKLKKYQNRFYVVFYSGDPRVHYVTYVKKVEPCKSPLRQWGVQCPDGNNQKYKITFKECKDNECLEFFPEYIGRGSLKTENRTRAFKASSRINLFYWDRYSLDSDQRAGTNECNLADNPVPSLPIQNFTNMGACSELGAVSRFDTEGNNLYPATIMMPIEFNKFYITADGNQRKKLVMQSDQWQADDADSQGDGQDQSPRRSSRTRTHDLIKGLHPDDRIVFARQVGSFQFSAFLFKKSSGVAPADTQNAPQ